MLVRIARRGFSRSIQSSASATVMARMRRKAQGVEDPQIEPGEPATAVIGQPVDVAANRRLRRCGSRAIDIAVKAANGKASIGPPWPSMTAAPGRQHGRASGSADSRNQAAFRSNSRSGCAAAGGPVVGIDVDAPAHIDREHPQVVDAMGVVGVLMGVEHAVDAIDVRSQQLLAQVRPGIDRARRRPPGPMRSTSSEQRRRRLRGSSGSQAPQPMPIRGTPPEEPQPRIVNRRLMRHAVRGRRHFRNSRKKFSRGQPGDLVDCRRHRLARPWRCGRQRPARWACRETAPAPDRARRSRRAAVERNGAGDVAQLVGVLEGEDAGKGHIERRARGRARPARPDEKQWSTAVNAALPHFLLENGAMSSSASRGMDHERQAGHAGGRDVRAEAPRLHVARAEIIMIVEPGFANRDDLGMAAGRRSPRGDIGLLGALCGACRPSTTRRHSARRSPGCVELPHPRRDGHHAATPAAGARQTTASTLRRSPGSRDGNGCRRSASGGSGLALPAAST